MQEREINKELQSKFFGKRFIGATVSGISLPRGSAERINGWIKKRTNFLVILGPPGTGKTYFCAALVGEYSHIFPDMRIFQEREYYGRIRKGIEKYTNYDFIEEVKHLTDNELFILDDLGSAKKNEWREEILMETIDMRYNSKKPTVFTSNLTKEEFYKTFEPRIPSRLFAKENTIIDLSEMQDMRIEGK